MTTPHTAALPTTSRTARYTPTTHPTSRSPPRPHRQDPPHPGPAAVLYPRPAVRVSSKDDLAEPVLTKRCLGVTAAIDSDHRNSGLARRGADHGHRPHLLDHHTRRSAHPRRGDAGHLRVAFGARPATR